MIKQLKITGIIPARLKSTRLPEKLLLEINNKPLIYYTYMHAKKSKLNDVVVATDHKKIYNKLAEMGCKVVMTSTKHRSGTERIGEISQKIKSNFYLNIQGDEPFINPSLINKFINYLRKHPATEILTAGKVIKDHKEINDPNIVKIVYSRNNQALYFSRHPIPYNRDMNKNIIYTKHIGIYGFRNDILKKVNKLSPSSLEKAEKLEQLRFLENGYKINIIITNIDSISIDTEEDYLKVKRMVEASNESL